MLLSVEIEEHRRRFRLLLGNQESVGAVPSIIAITVGLLNVINILFNIPAISSVVNPQILFGVIGGIILLQVAAVLIQGSFSFNQHLLTTLELILEEKNEGYLESSPEYV